MSGVTGALVIVRMASGMWVDDAVLAIVGRALRRISFRN
jgi:hypothetical protein